MRSRASKFYDTLDYEVSNARGIAYALREEIGSYWRHMHRCRKEAAQAAADPPADAYTRTSTRISADRSERQLRLLLGIRREGLGR
jgi:hypothetical protein